MKGALGSLGVLSLVLPFVISLVLTPGIRKIALRTDFVDHPGHDRIHRGRLPKGGGVAIYIAFWSVTWVTHSFDPQLLSLWLASTVLLLVGLVDDYMDLKWNVKLIGQVAAALIYVSGGDRIWFVTHPISGESVFIGWWGFPLTVFWLVALTNMINLIDGIDGLAAGVSTIACVPLTIVALKLGRYEVALMTIAMAGASAGFLPHNFHPSRIIMGDAGAMFLGFTLGAISVEGALKGTTALALTVPILSFGLPILETVFSFIRRIAVGKPFYARDLDHLHNRLLARGMTQRQTVLTLYTLSALMAWAAVLAFETGIMGTIIAFALVVIGAFLFTRHVGGIKGTVHSHMHNQTPGL